MEKQQIILIEDYEIVRNAMKENIEESDRFSVSTFESCEEMLPQFSQINPALVLTDITLPGISGIEGIKAIKKINPAIPIIVVTVHENSKIVFDALCAGAIGYLTKNSTKQKLLEAIEQALGGGAPMSVNIARMVVESFQNKKYSELSDRENEVLELLSKGRSYASIAEELFLSINTIKTYVKNIYDKLQVNSKEELIKLTNGNK